MPKDRRISFGELKVGVNFDIDGAGWVDVIKRETAEIIDALAVWETQNPDPETRRLCLEAQTRYEDACMWAVKAVTVR